MEKVPCGSTDKPSLSHQETGGREGRSGKGGVLPPSSAIIAAIDFKIFLLP